MLVASGGTKSTMGGLQQAIGVVIRRERRLRQTTLKGLAEQAAISVPYLGEIERGKKYPSASILERLAQALEVDVAEILEMAAAELRGETTSRRVGAIGFALPRSAKTAPRALINQLADILAPDDVTMLGEMGAFLAARRGIGFVVPG